MSNWIENKSLKSYNTFGLEAKARYFAEFTSIEELMALLDNPPAEKPLHILGGGSNMLLTKDLDKLVLHNQIKGIELIKEEGDAVFVRVASGENWHAFVQHCVAKDWRGLENLSLIPGNVGAAPIQNIGAYGVELKDCFESLDAFDLTTKELKTFDAEACSFGYRESVFKKKLKDQYVICSVTFKLSKSAELNTSYGAIKGELEKLGDVEIGIKQVADAVIAIRQSKLPDPAEIGNSGSFFKNPIIPHDQARKLKSRYSSCQMYSLNETESKLAAGWLIEKAGWKGYRKGDAGVHEKQALVLVNHGNASGDDIWELAGMIMRSIKRKFDVDLEPEVNIF